MTKDAELALGVNMSEAVKDNLGFAPVYDSSFSGRNPNINGYACVTGFFNQDYLDVTRGNGEKYRKIYEVFTHEGVDFRGKEGTEIKSFIYGTVLAYGTFGNYGRTIFISPNFDLFLNIFTKKA